MRASTESRRALSATALAVDNAGHPFVAWGDLSSGTPQIYMRGDAFDVHNVYYVNDALTPNDTFTTAAGSSSNSGLSPATPKDSVQGVIAAYALVTGDVILVDSGSYAGGFTVTSADSGFAIVGSAAVSSAVAGLASLGNPPNVIIQSMELGGGLTASGATNLNVESSILGQHHAQRQCRLASSAQHACRPDPQRRRCRGDSREQHDHRRAEHLRRNRVAGAQ